MDIIWWAFVGVVLVAYLVPGPDFVVIMRAATRGRRSGVAAALGAQTGLCVHVLLAVVGLSVVLARHPEVLTAIRVGGGLYLLYLGGRLLLPTLGDGGRAPSKPSQRQSARSLRSATTAVSTGTWSTFGQALTTNLLNPKAVLFFAAVLPQFVDAGGGAPIWVQVAALGAVDVALGVVAWTLVIVVGLQFARALHRDQARRWWDRVTGILLGGLGGVMILAKD